MAANMDNSKTPPSGVYKNPRLMHACTTIVGFTVHLQTTSGDVWEGIFNTFSSTFTICLDLAVKLDPKLLNTKDCLYKALKAGAKAEKQSFFDLKDIVRITAVDVDLNYATKDLAKLTTDSDISGYDASKAGEHKQLESWVDDDGNNVNADSLLSLDEVAIGNKSDSQNNSRGWDAQEMFRYNERVHNVSTTYDDKLTGYTLPLKQGKDWHLKSKRASAIAKEIEGNIKSQGRLAKEDGSDCEEEKFSAVQRPTPAPATARPAPTFANKAQHNVDVKEGGQQSQQQQSQPHQDIKQASSKVAGNNAAPEPQQSANQPQQHQQPQQQQQHQQQHRPSPTRQSHKDEDNKYNTMHRAMPNRLSGGNQNGTHKNYRPNRFTDRSRMDSLKNFGRSLNIGQPRQPQNQNQNINQVQNPMHNSPNNQSQPPPPAQSQQQPQQKQQTPQHQSQQQQQQQSQPSPQQQQQNQPQQQTPQQQQQPHLQHQTQPTQAPQQPSPTQHAPAQPQATITTASPSTTAATSTINTSTISERSDTGSLGSNQAKDHQSELARKSTLNPNAKEFVYKPRSHTTNPGAQTNGSNQASAGGTAAIDPANSSPMSQAAHAPYYQQVPMFPHGLSPHQQQHHAAQFMPNHTHPHFQNQIHYMSPVPPHFAQQMSQRYIRGNFQNYHHRGEHHNNVRPDYSQASMMAPTSTGQPFVPPPSGAPHPMNAYAASPQQPMIYGGPPQSMYPVVQAGFPQHMPHVMPNPPPYDGSTVYMPSQNYIVNP